MVSGETLKAHHAWYKGDSRGWQQQARLLQSLWRERRGLPARGKGDHDGSYLPDAEADERSGAAYISDDARSAVRRAIHEKQEGAVLQEKRLWCNLLSSQPLCFNLFGPLSEHHDDPRVSRALSRVWPDIATVTGIRYEWSPGRRNPRYLGNGTAFDVYIEYTDRAGEPRFIGIEVKYHEDLSGKEPKVRSRSLEVLLGSDTFSATAQDAVTKGRTAQLLLDHLLALSMNAHGERHGRFVILYPSLNAKVEKYATTYRSQLVDGDRTFQALTLEDFVSALAAEFDEAWVSEFRTRYLDVSVIDLLEAADS